MPDLSMEAGGSFSLAAALMSQSFVMVKSDLLQSRRPLSVGARLFFVLDQGKVDHFERQAPFVNSAARVAITAGRTVWSLPVQDLVQRPAEQGFLAGDSAHEQVRVVQILAHRLIAGVAGGGNTPRVQDAVAVFARRQANLVIELQRTAEINARGAFVTKAGL